MDKLKLAVQIISKHIKAKRATGEVPVFLGVRGMLALMYDRISKFSQNEEDVSEYVLDLAVMAVFAFSTVLPDMEFNDIPNTEEEPLLERNNEGPTSEEEESDTNVDESVVDPRWTPVNPGNPLSTATPMSHRDEEEIDE